MKHPHRSLALMLGIALLPLTAGQAWGQAATVDLAAQKQYIRGFGGMVHIPWAGDLNAAERTLVFGKGDGQLGFTVLRIAVPDSNTSDTSYVATSKAAIAAGGLVYATPWNGQSTMNTADFATYAYFTAFVTTMKNAGAELYAISVQNEPDYANEWRKWTQAQCHDFVLQYGDKVGTKLMGCESFNYAKSFYNPILNDAAALEKLGVLGTHLYGTPVSGYPYPLFDTKAAGKVERWMTEHYTDSNTDANQWPNALNVATELHNSMVKAQFNVYTWWYIKRSYGPINNGAVTKRGWCMAHWSKFVRPGFYRVDATEAPKSGVSLSAYKSNTDVVLVAVNTGSAASVDVSIKGSSISSFDKYTTSSSKNFASDGKVTASGGTLTLALDGSSVTTFHGTSSDIPISTGGSGGGGSTGAAGAGGTTVIATTSRTGGAVTGGTRTTGAGGTVGGGTVATSSSRVGGSSAVAISSASGGVSAVSNSSRVGGSSSSAVASSSSQGGSSSGGAGNGGQSSSEQGGATGAGNNSSKSSSTPVVTGDGGGGCTFMSGATPTGLLPFALTLAGLIGLLARRRRSR